MFKAVQGPMIMFASLGVGIELYRGVRFADRILECPFPVFPLEEVIGQESPVLVNPLGKNGFHRFPDFLMQKFARWSQKRLIGDLLRQGVVKDIFLSLIHISEPTRRTPISYAVFCLKK